MVVIASQGDGVAPGSELMGDLAGELKSYGFFRDAGGLSLENRSFIRPPMARIKYDPKGAQRRLLHGLGRGEPAHEGE